MIKIHLVLENETYKFKALEFLTRTIFRKVGRRRMYYAEYEIYSTRAPYKGAWVYMRIDKTCGYIKLHDVKDKDVMLNGLHVYLKNNTLEIHVDDKREKVEEVKSMLEVLHAEYEQFTQQ